MAPLTRALEVRRPLRVVSAPMGEAASTTDRTSHFSLSALISTVIVEPRKKSTHHCITHRTVHMRTITEPPAQSVLSHFPSHHHDLSSLTPKACFLLCKMVSALCRLCEGQGAHSLLAPQIWVLLSSLGFAYPRTVPARATPQEGPDTSEGPRHLRGAPSPQGGPDTSGGPRHLRRAPSL